MSSEWDYVPLRDCATWHSGGTPSTGNPDYWGGEIPWISAASLTDFRIRTSDRCVTKLGASNGTRLVPAGTTLFLVRGMSLKTEFRVGIATREVAFGQDCKALVPKNGIDSLYLAYAIKGRRQEILGLVDEASHGTGRLRTETIEELEVGVPALSEQRRIAGVLGALDDKIDHNRIVERRLCQALGEMFRHLVSGDREYAPLGDQVEVIMGQSPPGSTYSDDASSGLPLVQGMASFGERFPKSDVYTSAPTKRGVPTDVLMTVRAPVGEINVADRECCAGRGVAIIRSRHPAYAEQLMRYLQARWLEHESGTIYPSVNRAQIVSLDAPKPPETAVGDFDRQAWPLYELIGNLARQRARLAAIRDALLPKLVSGQLRVPESYDPA